MTAGDPPGTVGLTIVVVEDRRTLPTSIAKTLKRAGFAAHVAPDAEAGLKLARSLAADLVLLDVSGPGMDAIEACRRLRMFSDAYVIMLTGESTEADRLAGLSAGADDYLSAPAYQRDLVARIRSLPSRREPVADSSYARRFGSLEIDPDSHRVRVDGKAVELSRTEFRLLDALSARPGRTVSREDLLRQVWGEAWVDAGHIIEVHISNLRSKLGGEGRGHQHIATVRGFGYRMSAP